MFGTSRTRTDDLYLQDIRFTLNYSFLYNVNADNEIGSK